MVGHADRGPAGHRRDAQGLSADGDRAAGAQPSPEGGSRGVRGCGPVLGGRCRRAERFGQGALGAIASAGSTWLPLDGNASLANLFHRAGMSSSLAILSGGGLGLVGVAGLLRRKLPEEETYFGSVLAGLLASPLSWIHYDVVLIPLAARLWDRRHLSGVRFGLTIWVVFDLLSWVLASWTPIPIGMSALAGRLGLLWAVGRTGSAGHEQADADRVPSSFAQAA